VKGLGLTPFSKSPEIGGLNLSPKWQFSPPLPFSFPFPPSSFLSSTPLSFPRLVCHYMVAWRRGELNKKKTGMQLMQSLHPIAGICIDIILNRPRFRLYSPYYVDCVLLQGELIAPTCYYVDKGWGKVQTVVSILTAATYILRVGAVDYCTDRNHK
jgi:hypothetical protein